MSNFRLISPRQRAALAIRHTVTAQLSAHLRGPAPTVAGPPRYTVQSAIHARQHQPEPAPLHPTRTTVTIRAGDLARRYAARLDTHGQWLVGNARRRPEKSHRGEMHRGAGLSLRGDERRSEVLTRGAGSTQLGSGRGGGRDRGRAGAGGARE